MRSKVLGKGENFQLSTGRSNPDFVTGIVHTSCV